jgi:hypothetical protein
MKLTPTPRSITRIKNLLPSASTIAVCLNDGSPAETWAILAELNIQRCQAHTDFRFTCQGTANTTSLANTPTLAKDVIEWIEACANSETYQEAAA